MPHKYLESSPLNNHWIKCICFMLRMLRGQLDVLRTSLIAGLRFLFAFVVAVVVVCAVLFVCPPQAWAMAWWWYSPLLCGTSNPCAGSHSLCLLLQKQKDRRRGPREERRSRKTAFENQRGKKETNAAKKCGALLKRKLLMNYGITIPENLF